MGLLNDVRISIRTLFKKRAFTIAAVLTFAIGIGAASAIATIVDSDAAAAVAVSRFRADRPGRSATARKGRDRPGGEHGSSVHSWPERTKPLVLRVGTVDSFSNITRRRLTMTVAGRSARPNCTGHGYRRCCSGCSARSHNSERCSLRR